MTKTSFRKLQAIIMLVALVSGTSVPPSLAFNSEESITGTSTIATASPSIVTAEPTAGAALGVSSDVSGFDINRGVISEPNHPLAVEAILSPPISYLEIPGQHPSRQVASIIRVEEFPEVIVIDNDQYKAKKESEVFTWKDVQSEAGKTHISVGARFPIALLSSHSSKTCRVGDRVEAALKSDLIIADRLVARKHDRVFGHITSAHKARRLLIAEIAPKRWMRANGAIGIHFDEIVTADGDHLPLMAMPARMPRIVSNKAEGRVLGVNAKGEIVSPLSIQLKHQGIHLAIRGAASAGGVFSMGAVPVAFGVIGAIHPSFAFMHPVGTNVRHRRIKGFGMGVLSGMPGGFIVADYLIRGVESNLKPGDEFLVAFKQDFTGEPATSAQLNPQIKMKVQGEVVLKNKTSKPTQDAVPSTP